MTDRELLEMALSLLPNALDLQQSEIDDHITKYGEWYRPHRVEFMREYLSKTDELIELLLARLAQPEPDDGYCQACEGNHCTAKDGCVALDNPRAQPEPEPVAWAKPDDLIGDGYGHCFTVLSSQPATAFYVPLYTIPPQPEWIGLTDDELDKINGSPMRLEHSGLRNFVRAIEAKLKEKNNG